MTATPATAAWTDIAAHRRRDVKTTLPMTVLAALGASFWLGPAVPTAWLIGMLGLLVVHLMIGRWVERHPAPGRGLELFMAAYTFVYTGIYCALPLALFLHAQPTSIIAAACMLGAVAISSTAEVVISRPIGVASLLSLSAISALAVLGLGPSISPMQSLFAALSAFCFQGYIAQHAFRQAAAQRLLAASVETARAKEAEAANANAAKTVFLATMSHEIRTPLNGVLGMAQAMAHDTLSAPQRERLSVIRQSGEALTSILNDVLDLSKIEAGKLQLEMLEFDLGELLRATGSTFALLAREKGLSLTLDIAPAAQGAYVGDAMRLRQVLSNLISNAVKFTERGGIAIHVARDDAHNLLTIAVTDTGVGIPAEMAELLFAKFTQLDASTTRQHGGTGLGLAICRQLCQLMGGEIAVTSPPGHGATFTVSLPLPKVFAMPTPGGPRRADLEAGLAGPVLEQVVWDLTASVEHPDAAPPQPLPAPSAQQAPSPIEADLAADDLFDEPEALPLRILAAEDNPTNQLVLKAILGQAGIVPTMVDNGAEAVEAWNGGDWHVILMDIHMPVMDGVTALKEIRRREAAMGLPRTQIIALTANAMSHQVGDLLAAGMDAHVSKPIEVAALFAAIEGALERGQAAQVDGRSAAAVGF